jgi:hypothetical protein
VNRKKPKNVNLSTQNHFLDPSSSQTAMKSFSQKRNFWEKNFESCSEKKGKNGSADPPSESQKDFVNPFATRKSEPVYFLPTLSFPLPAILF